MKSPRFSPTRVSALALNTLTELSRLKIFYFLLIFALLVIGNSFFMAQLEFEEEFQMLKDISLGAMSIFTSLIAILATATLIPKDLEDRTIYTILSKPVPRYEYIAGKLFGVLLLLGISTIIMSALFLLVLWLRETTVLSGVTAQMGTDPDAKDAAERYIAEIKATTFNWNLLPGIVVIFLKAGLLASLTLFISSFASSGIFAMLISIAIYFIGHLQAVAREYWLGDSAMQWWAKPILALVALLFPDLQTFNLVDEIVAGTAVPLGMFLQTAALGVGYIIVYQLLATFMFSTREL